MRRCRGYIRGVSGLNRSDRERNGFASDLNRSASDLNSRADDLIRPSMYRSPQ